MKSGEIQTPALLQIWCDEFEQKLKAAVPGVHIHGEKAQRLPNTSYVGFEGTHGDGVLVNLDLEGFSASSAGWRVRREVSILAKCFWPWDVIRLSHALPFESVLVERRSRAITTHYWAFCPALSSA